MIKVSCGKETPSSLPSSYVVGKYGYEKLAIVGREKTKQLKKIAHRLYYCWSKWFNSLVIQCLAIPYYKCMVTTLSLRPSYMDGREAMNVPYLGFGGHVIFKTPMYKG